MPLHTSVTWSLRSAVAPSFPLFAFQGLSTAMVVSLIKGDVHIVPLCVLIHSVGVSDVGLSYSIHHYTVVFSLYIFLPSSLLPLPPPLNKRGDEKRKEGGIIREHGLLSRLWAC